MVRRKVWVWVLMLLGGINNTDTSFKTTKNMENNKYQNTSRDQVADRCEGQSQSELDSKPSPSHL